MRSILQVTVLALLLGAFGYVLNSQSEEYRIKNINKVLFSLELDSIRTVFEKDKNDIYTVFYVCFSKDSLFKIKAFETYVKESDSLSITIEKNSQKIILYKPYGY